MAAIDFLNRGPVPGMGAQGLLGQQPGSVNIPGFGLLNLVAPQQPAMGPGLLGMQQQGGQWQMPQGLGPQNTQGMAQQVGMLGLGGIDPNMLAAMGTPGAFPASMKRDVPLSKEPIFFDPTTMNYNPAQKYTNMSSALSGAVSNTIGGDPRRTSMQWKLYTGG